MILSISRYKRLWLLPIVAIISSCAAYSVVNSDRYQASSSSAIPPEYIPSPGFCRIWYKNRLPEQQPPQGDCDTLKNNLPENAVLLKG